MKWNILAAAGLGSILLALQPLAAKAVTLEPVEQITVKASLPTQSLPVQYDMRKAGLTTRVQRQGSYGMCWSFASLASLESTIIRQEPAIDLSEWSLAYYAYAPEDGFPVADNTDPLRMGGNFYVAAPMLTGWRGPVNEADAPFGDSSVLDPALTAGDLLERSVWHVTEADMLMYDIDAEITDAQRLAVKQMVYDGQAVAMSLYNINSLYNASTFTYYNAQNQRTGGSYHAVTIVGWDDAFPADSFRTPPPADGAFLCKNSWGPGWGDNGYFWVSYYDPSIVELYTISGEAPQKHTQQYQYDNYGFWSAMSVEESDPSAYMANIFTAQTDTCVTAVMFVTATEEQSYAVRVYKNVQDPADPTSGTASGRTRGMMELPGYHTVTLDTPVFLSAGERFSVTVHLSGDAGQLITCEAYSCYTTEHSDGTVSKEESMVSEEAIMRSFCPGESFYSQDGSEWHDLYDEPAMDSSKLDPRTGETTHRYCKVGNVCVRALTQEIGQVVFSTYAKAVPSGTPVTLTCPGAQEIWYSQNGVEFAPYTEPITIEKPTTLYAYAIKDGMTTQTVSQSYAIQTAQLSSLLRCDTHAYLEWEQLSDTCWTASCAGSKSLSLLPITTAQITSDAGVFSSGECTEVAGVPAVTLHTQEADKLDGTYVIYLTDVIRGNVNLDAAVNAADAADVLLYAAAKGAGAAPERDAAWLSRADCDENGTADAADAAIILQIAAENGAG